MQNFMDTFETLKQLFLNAFPNLHDCAFSGII